MPDHGIIFTAAMVRALLAGKTQTRRPVTQRNSECSRRDWACFHHWDKATPGGTHAGRPPNYWVVPFNAPDEHGLPEEEWSRLRLFPRIQPGDRIWVKETWCEHMDNGAVFYKADGWPKEAGMRWRSPIHMPRWASRITLLVKATRAERVQDITEEDARAEGAAPVVSPAMDALVAAAGANWKPLPYTSGFAGLWDSVYGPGAWARNDWLWVYEFEREAAR